MDASEKPKVWFYAKEYGWGWGLPACWQGWVVLVGYIALLALGPFLFSLDRQLPHFLLFTGVLTSLLLVVCWWKGEKPAWRWGSRTGDSQKANQRVLLFVHLSLGPLLLVLGLFFRTYPPLDINGRYGYRTSTSMQSQQVWEEAQQYSADAIIVAALITTGYQVFSCFAMQPLASFLTSTGVLIVTLLSTLFATEIHLKRYVDEHGKETSTPVSERQLEKAK